MPSPSPNASDGRPTASVESPVPADNTASPPRALAETAAVVGLESAPLPGAPSAAVEPLPAASSSSQTLAEAASADRRPEQQEPADELDKSDNEGAPEHVVGGTRDFGVLPIPRWLRYDSEKPPEFGLVLNAAFGFTATFTVANLYYPQPILIVLSENFGVSYDEVTNIPTLLQASYALGLAFICPCGDLVRRRPMLLLVIACSAILSLILAVVPSIKSFQAISFFLGAASVTPQILLPLAGDLAPPERRATALSIVLSGLLLGILLARVLAGLIAEKASVAALYYMSFGPLYNLQVLIWLLVYLMVPDYPAKNKHLSYFQILWSMVKYFVTEPVLVQSSLITCAASAIFSAFWTSSTFLLGDVYNYNSLTIGLFALVGVAGVLLAPFIGRLIDSLVSWVGVFLGILIVMGSQAVFTGAAAANVGAIVVVIFLLDIGQQLQQVSNSTRIFAINAAARARFSAVFLVWNFAGQLIGTAAGTRVYLKYGYRAEGGLCLGLLGFMLFILCLRGPHCPTKQWIGWAGGWELRKSVAERKKREAEEALEKNREKEV
ncbi:hypothetical protein JCM6882_003423 [Rhodosporidiobolus microsporus]